MTPLGKWLLAAFLVNQANQRQFPFKKPQNQTGCLVMLVVTIVLVWAVIP